MILPGSYANGFAPRDGQPLYPELWRGCVGAWAPCLGPTGLTLRDCSGFGNHGTLTNGPIFRPTSGLQSLAFDGSNDMSVCGYSSTHNTVGGAGWMISAWTHTTSNPAVGTIICRGDLANIPQQRDFFLFSTSGNWSIQNATGGNFPIVSSAGALALNRWQHVAAYCYASGSAGLIVDGKQVANGTLRIDVPTTTIRFITIGRSNNGGDGYSFPWNGSIGDVRLYSIVNPEILYSLSKRPTIAYELAARRRASVQVVGFNRRRRLLVGAGS